MKHFLFVLLVLYATGCASLPKKYPCGNEESVELTDDEQNRAIPIEIYTPAGLAENAYTKVALLSAGYNGSNTEYTFLARALTKNGFLVVGIQHEQPQDPPIAGSGDIYSARMPVWERGVKNLKFVRAYLHARFPKTKTAKWLLLGHSNGGDISLHYAQSFPSEIDAVITFDHRRFPIPRQIHPPVLSFRADEFEADKGVLPSAEEAAQFRTQVIWLKNTRHNDLRDAGRASLKAALVRDIEHFLIAIRF